MFAERRKKVAEYLNWKEIKPDILYFKASLFIL
jgi:hypothetical protein